MSEGQGKDSDSHKYYQLSLKLANHLQYPLYSLTRPVSHGIIQRRLERTPNDFSLYFVNPRVQLPMG